MYFYQLKLKTVKMYNYKIGSTNISNSTKFSGLLRLVLIELQQKKP